MQKVPWPITIVQSENGMPEIWMNEFRAMPVTTPGSAIGSTSSSDTDSRPKKRKRATANAAALPSRIAISAASEAAFERQHERGADLRVVEHRAEPARRERP